MRVAVIGAAPTGLGAAFRLHELIESGQLDAKDLDIVIFEQEEKAGGLSCSVRDSKGFLWDMGGHITFHHNQPYYEKATKWAVDDWNHLVRNCQVDMNYLYGKEGIELVPYPAQFAVPLFPEDVKQACLEDLKERYEKEPEGNPQNFEEWVLKHFGPTILNTFFIPYTRKVWTVTPKEMSPHWVGTRVAKLPQEKLEELCAMDPDELKTADFGWGPNAIFDFPKYGGTGNVWTSMADKLPQKWFRYNTRVTSVNPHGKSLKFLEKDSDEEKELSYDLLLNSAPIDQLVKHTGIVPQLDILHNKVFVVGVGLKLPMTPFVEDKTWLYFPDPNVPFYRVTILSRYGEVTPDASKFWSVMCECALPADDPTTEEEIRDRTVKGLITKTIIREDAIESVFSCTLPYGYPIPTPQRDAELARAHRALERESIYSRGRFGGWKYEASNQDHCFMQGKEFVDRLFLGEAEKMYKTGLVESKQG